MTKTYYNMKSIPGGYRMAKFDDMFNVEAVYEISYRQGYFFCDCMAGNKPTCRHREMVKTFCSHKAVNSGKFFCYDENEWYPAIT